MSAPDEFRNVGSLHDPAAVVTPDRVAVVATDTGEKVTYESLADRTARAGNALAEFGVTRGDRVALCYPNDARFLALYFGAMRIGAVPVPVNVHLPTETITYVLDDCDAALAVVGDDADVRDAVVPAAERASGIELLAMDGGSVREVDATTVEAFAPSFERASPSLDPVDVESDDAAIQLYTSGSTGRPKGVVLTHGGVYWNTTTFRNVNLLDSSERVLVVTPLFHKMATVNLKAIFAAGGSAVLMGEYDAAAAARAIDEYDVTFLTGVPAVYQTLIDAVESGDADVSSVETGVCGGDAVPDALHDDFETAFGGRLIENYGLTEGGPMVASTPRWGVRKRGSCGLALPGVGTRVVDPDGTEELETNERGELLVRNPGVARYYQRPDETAASFVTLDGGRFLRTGDLARKDEDGFHYILGRTDDMFIVGGENLYPSEVESLLAGHDAVDEVVVVPAPHDVKGEAPVAFVIPDGDVTEQTLREFALDRGPAYAHPRRVFFVDSFPLTGADKVDRSALERDARERVDGSL